MKFKLSGIAVAAIVLGVAACETAPKENATLIQAREAVARAESSPDVGKYSAAELDRARKLLVNAQGAAEQKGANDKITAQYAYLATQMAHIAEQHAREQVAMARVKAGDVERQQILLAARESEAQQAHAEAQQARNEAQNAQAQVAQAQAQSQQMAKELQDMQAAQTKRGIVLTLGDVLFDTGRADLKPGAERSIEQLTSFLNEHPERRVQVEGFTDSQGPNDYNMELSQKRADAVAMAIIQRGIDAQRVRAMGYGEEFPVASNKDSGSRQLNRRVEIVVSNGDQAIPSRAASGSP
ncbi:MAG TPA: OmpA family protein [Steroidobacteraceae bacterium]|jgi:outer membrane protein OmpA-like peptidoglycan-associated protein|nr:OmpA family protein [Steroidobacteraceae bacterium]